MADKHRRITDKCIAKRLWEAGTPYLQVAGYFPVLGGIATAVYILCGFVKDTEAYGLRITTVEQSDGHQNEEIAALKQRQEDMAKEVHALYTHMLGSR